MILPVEATTRLVDAPFDIGSEPDVCNAWLDGRHYGHSIILWAFISSLARLRRVEEASPGDPRPFLLSSMVLIVTGEIPGPIFHCGATRLTPMPWTMYCVPLPDVSRKFLVVGN